MSNQKRTKEYLAKEKVKCPRCRHHGRDVKFRAVSNKDLCNNCTRDIIAAKGLKSYPLRAV